MGSQPDIVAELYRHSLPRLGAYAFLLTGSHAEAEELVQAAIVKVFARPRRLTNLPQAEAYVRTAIRTLHIDGMRRRVRWARVAPRLATPDAVAGPGDQVDTADAVGLAMDSLAPRVRAVVAMYYWEDLSVAEIAGALHVSVGTVKGYLRDGRTALAPLLGDDDEPERATIVEARP